jgi:hypothetical protein
MNKTSITALVVGVVALVLSGYAFFSASPNLGSYIPPVQSAGGFVASYSTSTVYTIGCSPTNIQWLGTSALATATIQAATTTFAACPNLNNFGTSVGGKIVNDSTNTVAYAAGTGVVYKCETNGVGTSTIGSGGTCTASGFTLLASSTVDYSALFDGTSSTLIIDVANNYH